MNKFGKAFLIRTAGFKTHSLAYGLLYIKSYLRKAGIDSYVFDRESSRSLYLLKNTLLEYDPDVIGISAMTAQSLDAKFIIKNIREWVGSKKIIIVGGVHFTALPNDGIKYGADYIIRGEGELAMLDFPIKGPPEKDKLIKGKTVSELDYIPMITMSDLRPFVKSPENYHDKGIHVITARGCPYNCNFCLGKDQRPRGIRYHSIDYIVEYISQIVKEFGIYSFNIVDDIFVIKPARVMEFCEKVQKRISIPLRFHCFTHADHGNVELYRKMRETGFHRISMGVEHGNDKILSLMGKHTTKAKIEETYSRIYIAGIDLNLTYILGNIEETNKTITETVDFAIYLHKRYKTSSWFSYMQPLPGSPIYNVAEKYGTYLPKERSYQNIDLCYVPFNVTVEHIIKERERGMKLANSHPRRSFKRLKSIIKRIL